MCENQENNTQKVTEEKLACEYPYLNTDLPLDVRINDLVSRMTLDEKIGIIPTQQAAVQRLGIKEYNVGGEAAHGVVTKMGKATVFPQPIGLSSTWDTELLEKIGSVIGDEARIYYKRREEKGGLTLWAPTIDMERDPRWGRTEEAYGEDPYLTGELSANLIKGMQGDHPFYLKLVPAPKHFYANNKEEGRIWESSSISPRNKYEYYLRAFKPAFVCGKAGSMMTAYNEINGTPCIVNPEVQKIVKDEWGCPGFIVCDGGDMSQTVEFHKYYETHAETIANAIKSGVDVMTDEAELVIKSTKEAIERGLLTEEELDRAVKNVFKIRFRLGQFDSDELNPYANIPESLLCSEEHNALALKAARESVVLLKNENNTLPLNKDNVKKVAVIGSLGNEIYRSWYTGKQPYKVTPLQGIEKKLQGKTVLYKSGNDIVNILSIANNKFLSIEDDKNQLVANKDNKGESFEITDWGWSSFALRAQINNKFVTTDDISVTANADDIWGWNVKEVFKINSDIDDTHTINTWNNRSVIATENGTQPLSVVDEISKLNEGKFKINKVVDGLEEATQAAKESDVAIVFVGNHPLINAKEEFDRKDITLPPAQEELIKEVYKANPNTIVVIVGGYPFAINWENENIPAILYASHGCQELGNAVADVLFGDYSPAGRLSMTWYKSIEQLPKISDYDIIKGKRTYMYFEDKPLYPFGHGLTYTNFEYSNLSLSSGEMDEQGKITVQVDVKNTGNIDSDEVVQMYTAAVNSRVKRPTKELKGFKRLHIKAGETKRVEFTLQAEQLAFWDVTRDKFCVESGSYTVMIGTSSDNIALKDTLKVNGETIPYRNLTKVTAAENYDDYYGVTINECKEGGTCVCSNNGNEWTMFDEVNFSDDINSFEARVSNTFGKGVIEIRLDNIDGELIGVCTVEKTESMQTWITSSCSIACVQGVHKIYLILTRGINVKNFKFI